MNALGITATTNKHRNVDLRIKRSPLLLFIAYPRVSFIKRCRYYYLLHNVIATKTFGTWRLFADRLCLHTDRPHTIVNNGLSEYYVWRRPLHSFTVIKPTFQNKRLNAIRNFPWNWGRWGTRWTRIASKTRVSGFSGTSWPLFFYVHVQDMTFISLSKCL